jgi:cytochrome c2
MHVHFGKMGHAANRAKPDEVVPGNNMKPYGGLTSAEDRAKVIVFLESPTTN